MKKEEILENLRRIAEGDTYNDLEGLSVTLRWLASEAEISEDNLKNNPNAPKEK